MASQRLAKATEVKVVRDDEGYDVDVLLKELRRLVVPRAKGGAAIA